MFMNRTLRHNSA